MKTFKEFINESEYNNKRNYEISNNGSVETKSRNLKNL